MMTRSKVELKNEIVDGLEKFPMTTHGVSRHINADYKTAERRLEELKEDGVIIKDGSKWRMNK
jgi:predicted transcriptional regulator